MGKTERLEAMKRRQVDGLIEQPQDTQISGSMFIAGKMLNSILEDYLMLHSRACTVGP